VRVQIGGRHGDRDRHIDRQTEIDRDTETDTETDIETGWMFTSTAIDKFY